MPTGYTVRRPTMGDVDGAFEVLAASDRADHGTVDFPRDEFSLAWKHIDLETDAWVVEDADRGIVVGVAWIKDRAGAYFDANVVVHPDHGGRGISSHLL